MHATPSGTSPAHPDWSEQFFRSLLDLSDIAVLALNQNHEVVYANHYLCDNIIGMPQHMVIGMSLSGEKTVPDEEMQRVMDSTRKVLEHGEPDRIENWALHKDGSKHLMYWASVPVLAPDGTVSYLLATGLDVTEQRRQQFRLEALAHRDSLTGLYNRTYFEHRLSEDMSRARAEDIGLALLYIDLDGFKPVNDRYGHAAGDAVLQEVALRLRKCLRQNDVVCRIGGDEFTVILSGVSSHSDTDSISRQMLESLAPPCVTHGEEHLLGASIGIAFMSPSDTPQELVRKSDAAMYSAKQAGKGRHAYFPA